jgi:hypothetical protein
VDSRPLLLQLRLRGRIADPGTAESAAVVAGGHALARGSNLVLAPTGRAAAEIEFRLEGPARDAVVATYEPFLARNAELIKVCHDWQVGPSGHGNDHRDAKYDWAVIDRLAAIDDRTAPVIRRLGRTVAEFADYRPRLREARTRVEDGDRDWFTSPRLDSYHTVWMELHEHLLLGLGLDRSSESADTLR